MTYSYHYTSSFEFTAWSEDDLVSGNLCPGSVFTVPDCATTTFEVRDDDRYLSGDSCYNENADDRRYQKASILEHGEEVGNGGQIYAEQYFWVQDQHGNWYVLVEIEQEGSSDSWFTFHESYGRPPAGAELTVKSACNVTSDWLKYDDLDAGCLKPPTGEISGRYFVDADCDASEWNADTGTWEEGLAGKKVYLIDHNGTVVATTTTDADGRYSFEGLADGRYKVEFEGEDGAEFVAADAAHYTKDSDVVRVDGDGDGSTDWIQICNGETKHDIDAGVKALTGSVSGTVFCDIECDGINGQVEIKPGCDYTIEAEHMWKYGFSKVYGDHASNGKLVKLDCVGGEGTLCTEFNGKNGTYDVSIRVQDENDGQSKIKLLVNGHFVEAIRLDRDSDGGGSDDGGFSTYVIQDVELKTGDDLTLAVWGDGGEFVRIDKIDLEGEDTTIVTPEPPKAGVTVKLLAADGTLVATTVTDAHGNYRFDDVPVGEYRIMGVAPDGTEFTIKDAGTDDTIDSDVGSDGVSDVIRVVADGNTDVDLGLCEKEEEPASLSGRYFCDENDDSLDNGEPGIEGILVTLLNADGSPTGLTTRTDADGNYSFTDLAPGSYRVQFEADPTGKTFVDQDVDGDVSDDIDSDVDPATGTTGVITLAEGEDKKDVDAGVEDPKTASLAGRYFCDENDNDLDDGEPGIEGILVTLLDAAGNPTGRTTTTDANGEYEFTGLAAGTYSVQFAADPTGKVFVAKDVDGNANDVDDSDVDPGTGTTDAFTLAIGERKENVDAGVEDPKTASLAGRYFCDENDNDLDDGEPGIEGILVTLLDAAGNPTGRTTTTDANGEYEFTGLAAGTYSVQFAADPTGKVFVAKDVDGNANDVDDSDVDPGTGTTDAFTLAIGERKENVDAGVEDPKTASLAGRYFCDENDNDLDDGEPGIEGILVTLLDAAGNPTGRTTTTDANGEYEFTGLAAGTYSVQFAADPTGKVFVAKDVDGNANDVDDSDVDPGTGTTDAFTLAIGERKENVDAGVEDPKTASLAGRYFCDENDNDLDDGEPGIEGILVTLLDAAGNPTGRTTTTDANGEYEFTGLAAGTYSVQFAADPTGKVFVAKDVDGNANDVDDSDVDPGTGTTDAFTLAIGERKENVDAGVENFDPETTPDTAKTCYDEAVEVDVLLNDSDPNGGTLTITAVNGIAIVDGGPAIDVDGVSVALVDGKLVFDGEAKHADLLTGEEATDSFTYTVEDGQGGSAEGTVDVTFCGATDTIEKIEESLPDSVVFQVINENDPLGSSTDAWTLFLTTSDTRLAGTFENAYCLSVFDDVFAGDFGEDITTAPEIVADVELSDTDLATTALDGQVGINGETAEENLDLVNWIINQDFGSVDNGDGTGETYTDAEIQGAVWALTDGDALAGFGVADGVFVADGAGTAENAKEILDLALDNGEGFEAGAGDLVGVIVDPTDPSSQQPYVIGIELFEECLC
jgi:serine-aspartate repeat-containing protein C/D/E